MDNISHDAAQVLDIMREVLAQHMREGLPDFQIRRALVIGKHSGRIIGDLQIERGNDVAGGLRLTMESGAEYDLMLTPTEREESTNG